MEWHWRKTLTYALLKAYPCALLALHWITCRSELPLLHVLHTSSIFSCRLPFTSWYRGAKLLAVNIQTQYKRVYAMYFIWDYIAKFVYSDSALYRSSCSFLIPPSLPLLCQHQNCHISTVQLSQHCLSQIDVASTACPCRFVLATMWSSFSCWWYCTQLWSIKFQPALSTFAPFFILFTLQPCLILLTFINLNFSVCVKPGSNHPLPPLPSAPNWFLLFSVNDDSYHSYLHIVIVRTRVVGPS